MLFSFLEYKIRQVLTSAHHPQMNGTCEQENQLIITILNWKVIYTTFKNSWAKSLEKFINEYNNIPSPPIQ